MSDVEYYLLEKDGESSKCGGLDLGKCMDSDENSGGGSAFPKEANNPSVRGDNLEENRIKTNTTNVVEHNQESKGSDDQLLSFLSSQEGSPDINPNRDAQGENDANVCKSTENMLKDLIDMNVGNGNGVNPQGKNETTITKQITDASDSSSVENTHPNSTKIQVADSQANSKSLTEILDDFCNAPSEIIAPSEMSFSALVESDDADKKISHNSQLKNQDIEMSEIWSGENSEKVIENGSTSQDLKVDILKENKTADNSEEDMETEEYVGKINSEDSKETDDVKDQHDSSEKVEKNTKISSDRKKRIVKELDSEETKSDDKDKEEEMETIENEVVAKNMEKVVISGQEEKGKNETVAKITELEENTTNVNTIDRDLGSSSKYAVEGELESSAMETEEGSKIAESDEKGMETQEKTNDLADEETGTQENSADLVAKEKGCNLAHNNRFSQKKSESSADQEDEKEIIYNESKDVRDEDIENSQKEKLKAVSLKGKVNVNTITDKDSPDMAKEKSPETVGDAENGKKFDTKNKNKDKSVKIQVTSKNHETVVEINSNDKSPVKDTTISATEKEIFESPKQNSAESLNEAKQKPPSKSAENETPKGKSKADNGNPVVVSSGKQNNADDGFVDYDEESIENITKTIKSFTSESASEKKQGKRNDSSKKADSSPSKQVILVKTSSNVERVKRKLEEILEKSKGEEDAAIAELQRMKREKTDILNAITTEMEKLKAILVKGKQG